MHEVNSFSSPSFLFHKALQRGGNCEMVLFALGHFIYEFCLIIIDRVLI